MNKSYMSFLCIKKGIYLDTFESYCWLWEFQNYALTQITIVNCSRSFKIDIWNLELSYLKMKKKNILVITNGKILIRLILIIILSDVKSICFCDTKQIYCLTIWSQSFKTLKCSRIRFFKHILHTQIILVKLL